MIRYTFVTRIQSFFNSPKSINKIYHINKIKDKKTHRLISTDKTKSFEKTQHTFMTKSTQQTKNLRGLCKPDKEFKQEG